MGRARKDTLSKSLVGNHVMLGNSIGTCTVTPMKGVFVSVCACLYTHLHMPTSMHTKY